MKNKRLIILLTTAAGLLSIPFIAMQFTSEVNWKGSDFMLMGTLLTGMVFLVELVLRKVKGIRNRIVICGSILLIFLLIWAELAVGIFNTPFAGS